MGSAIGSVLHDYKIHVRRNVLLHHGTHATRQFIFIFNGILFYKKGVVSGYDDSIQMVHRTGIYMAYILH